MNTDRVKQACSSPCYDTLSRHVAKLNAVLHKVDQTLIQLPTKLSKKRKLNFSGAIERKAADKIREGLNLAFGLIKT